MMHIRAVHHRQDFDLVRPHALQRQIQPLVGVDVRKHRRIHQLTKLLVRVLLQFASPPAKG